jgi:alpha-1,2-mannosyltransferase
MYCLTVAFGAWFISKYSLAVTAVACGVILGWPFCIVLAIPLAFNSLYKAGFLEVFKWGIISLVCFLVSFYCKYCISLILFFKASFNFDRLLLLS